MAGIPGRSPLARGPMGGDQYTNVHNGFFRDKRLSAKAKGIFGLISTHKDKFEVSEASVVADMTDGVDSIRTGLKELQRFHYLIRIRERDAQGKLGDGVWFYTDLPAQILATGITDENIIANRVREEFDKWIEKNRRSTPKPENPMLGTTSANAEPSPSDEPREADTSTETADSNYLPSSEPKRDFPNLDNPSLENPMTKKTTNYKNTKSPKKSKKEKSSIDAGAHAHGAGIDPWSADFVPEPVADEIHEQDRTIEDFLSTSFAEKDDSQEVTATGLSKAALGAYKRMIEQRPAARQDYMDLISNLPWTLYGRKAPVRISDAKSLAKFAAHMADDHYTNNEITRHLSAALRSCDGRNPVLYLENAMIGDLRPARNTSTTDIDYEQDFWGNPLPNSTNDDLEGNSMQAVLAQLAAVKAQTAKRRQHQATQQALHKAEAQKTKAERLTVSPGRQAAREAAAKAARRFHIPLQKPLRSKINA